MFWERFYNLCLSRETKPNPVCVELGFSNATATKWKNGSVPGAESLNKIAEYFGVTPAYLLGYTEEKEKSPVETGLSEKHQRLITAYDNSEPVIQATVDKILNIDQPKEEKVFKVKIAARNGGGITEKTLTEEEYKRLMGLPDVEDI